MVFPKEQNQHQRFGISIYVHLKCYFSTAHIGGSRLEAQFISDGYELASNSVAYSDVLTS